MPDPREELVPVRELITAIASSTHYAQAIKMENAFLPSFIKKDPYAKTSGIPISYFV
jgi:hypothetical protein